MTAQDYISAKLQALKEPIKHEKVTTDQIEQAIFAKVMSKKFRKIKADDDAKEITKKAIRHAVQSNSPVKLNLIFGGNKLWRFDEAPEIDWSEFFATIYLAFWLKSIASVHIPGAYLEFYSEDVVLENMNNLPKSESDKYSKTFIEMLGWLEQYLPIGVTLGYKRYGDEYADISEYLAELEVAKTKVSKELGGKLPELTPHQKEATEMNVQLLPGQADDPLWREKAELIHQSIERTETMERYIADTSFIPTSTTNFAGCIVTGSTKKSYAKFWVAVGALQETQDSFNDIVLTPKQLESAKFNWEDMKIEGLTGKNFSKIRVIRN